VYLGTQPILRFESVGSSSRVYYLEDGIGSVIGLAPQGSPDTSNTTRLFYNGFGSTRSTNGPAPTIPSGTEGDFRFHAAWWESATHFYHMRAREYDPRTGRFLSRDTHDGEFRTVESRNPYNYGFATPTVYSDPTGHFSLIEINLTGAINTTLQTLRTVAVNYSKNKATEKIVDSFANVAYQQLELLFPGLSSIRALFAEGPGKAGEKLESMLGQAVCNRLPTFVRENMWLGPAVARDGDPVSDGLGCTLHFLAPKKGTGKAGVARPDFILSPTGPSDLPFGGYEKAYLIGDIKLSGQQLYSQYIADGAERTGQGLAIVNFAARHSQTRIVLFLTIYPGNKSDLAKFKTSVFRRALKKGVIIFVLSAR
jgi:RHS repeat-associated protein